jgi:hypothetical protein
MMETERVEDGNAFPMSWESADLGLRAAWEGTNRGKSLRFGNLTD